MFWECLKVFPDETSREKLDAFVLVPPSKLFLCHSGQSLKRNLPAFLELQIFLFQVSEHLTKTCLHRSGSLSSLPGTSTASRAAFESARTTSRI